MKMTYAAAASILIALAAVCAAAEPPPPSSPPPALRGGAMGGACREDIHNLCPDVKPGEGRLKECIKAHFKALSPGCRDAIRESRREHMNESGPPGAPASHGTSPATTPPPGAPPVSTPPPPR